MQKHQQLNQKSSEEEVIVNMTPLVKYIAKKYIGLIYSTRRLEDCFSYEDVVQEGLIGALQAWRNYDWTSIYSYKTFANHRINGAIKDALRNIDILSRLRRLQVSRLHGIIRQLIITLIRYPMQSEIKEAWKKEDWSENDFQQALTDFNNNRILRFSEIQSDHIDEDELTLHEFLNESQNAFATQQNLSSFFQSERSELLASLVQNLPLKLQHIIILYYINDLTLKEIGKIMQLTESRICQLHEKAIQKMQAQIKDGRYEFTRLKDYA